ncbi:multiple RNA-binding domain-containing protein 1 [Canna indica]|uniref:Multiple RNA-binding domain-containing protein 1 n=1 Tax=Canna indica TaxID=4628 RepID=A0AAQ3QQI2_9LILI|nr:multiple RNA-binding domain-containing protein 1 [Canna indica]
MTLLHHQPPFSSFLLPPLPSRSPSPIPTMLRSRPLLTRSLRPSLPPRGNPRHVHVLRPVRGCATSDSAISHTAPPPSSRIFIKGLSRTTSEGFLAKTFSSFGEVMKVKIITSRSASQSLGLAYIWYANEQQASMAVKEMDGKFFDGRFIAVTIAEPESPSKQVRPRPYRF